MIGCYSSVAIPKNCPDSLKLRERMGLSPLKIIYAVERFNWLLTFKNFTIPLSAPIAKKLLIVGCIAKAVMSNF
jgi:hypothetical protein